MSGRSSGSRFNPLPIEGEEDDSGSDSSAEEMNSDYFRKLSAGPSILVHGEQSPHAVPKNISGQRNVMPRSMRSGSKEEPSDLEFVWDHYRRESQHYDEEGADALENIFGQPSQGSSQTQFEISKSIVEDVAILRGIGFNIDYPNGKLGAGFYGVVYSGHYGSADPNDASSRFAVKVIEFNTSTDSDTITYRRERFETEKYILTTANHPNVVSVKMIINMGEIRSFRFMDTPSYSTERFLSPERVYLIMDFADGGALDDWIHKNYNHMTAAIRIDIIRDLFAGLFYLHSESIVHGDVHSGNVLIFSKVDGVVAKWADFGLGSVGSNKQYTYRKPRDQDMKSEFRSDIKGMQAVFWNIMKERQANETPEEKELMNQVQNMLKFMNQKKIKSLHEVYRQFKHILEDELIFEEQHY